ncbi:hypothetical protein Fot_21827 [Forsythia ovata]|uniref:Uncharacterized protein n=1 Tax=Forsythia ovata TaxID=205694 RepID=A0ABD1UVY3_9LAMI
MSSGETDKDWDFNWMGTPECNVVITKLDDEQEVQQHDNCDIHSNVERDVNIDMEDETTRHCNEHAAPEIVTVDFNWDEPIVNESDEGDFNWDEPIVDLSYHTNFNWEEPVVSTVGKEQATEQTLHQATDHIEYNWDEPAVDNVHSDYDLSDEL